MLNIKYPLQNSILNAGYTFSGVSLSRSSHNVSP